MSTSGLHHNLFVYGTLKRGFYNYNVYLARAVQNGLADYRGTAITAGSFALNIRGPRNIPALSVPEEKSGALPVHGEVYAITDSVLQAMDLLEGVARGFYYRDNQSVQLTETTTGQKNTILEDCWVYLQEGSNPSDANLTCYPDYTAELHSLYVPPTTKPDPEILKLLVQPTASED